MPRESEKEAVRHLSGTPRQFHGSDKILDQMISYPCRKSRPDMKELMEQRVQLRKVVEIRISQGWTCLKEQQARVATGQKGQQVKQDFLKMLMSNPQGTKRAGLEITESGVEPDARRQRTAEGTTSTTRNVADSDIQ